MSRSKPPGYSVEVRIVTTVRSSDMDQLVTDFTTTGRTDFSYSTAGVAAGITPALAAALHAHNRIAGALEGKHEDV